MTPQDITPAMDPDDATLTELWVGQIMQGAVAHHGLEGLPADAVELALDVAGRMLAAYKRRAAR